MKLHRWLAAALPVLALLALHADAQDKKPSVTWKKIVLDRTFRSEGVGVTDVNKDGKVDVIVGDCWYEAPKNQGDPWKRHILRQIRDKKGDLVPADRAFDLLVYSKSFCCFTDDFNGDGWSDVIVIPFPGEPCYWYANPGAKGGRWKEHLLTNSACNETPIYVDLFKTGKKLLVMGWNPQKDEKDISKGNYDDRGELCYFIPGKDPTQAWERISVSGPSAKGKPIPGTGRFSHGLGHGDVNGDGRVDIIVPQGWWEQPEKLSDKAWKFHAGKITDACADMYTYDLDGDGKADILSTSAHNYGFWWSQQKDLNSFLQRPLFLPPGDVAKLPKDHGLSADELALLQAINARRAEAKSAPWAIQPALVEWARDSLRPGSTKGPPKDYIAKGGSIVWAQGGKGGKGDVDVKEAAKELMEKLAEDGPKPLPPNLEVGVAIASGKDKGAYTIVLGTRKQFSLPSQTHAMHKVDIDGDGLQDLVTGRRWWAHGPKGDAGPNDPAYLYWFQAKRGKDGMVSFTPHVIDDDSGIGTSFVIADMNGDGLPDVIVANKKGVHVFLQGR